MKWVILPTDIAFFVMLCVLGVYIWRVRDNAVQSATWQRVFVRRTGKISALVLAFFLLIAAVDSIHFRKGDSNKTQSALDVVLGKLADSKEKSYSRPLASVLMIKETRMVDNVQVRDFPPLKWPEGHILGTDKAGNDVLYVAIKSIRTAVVIGALTTLISLPFAILLGIAAGYLRGRADQVIQYIYTVLSSIPGILLIAASVLMMQVWIDKHAAWFETGLERADMRLLMLTVVLGLTGWAGLARLLRGEVMKLREQEYVIAAQAFGVSTWRIMLRHLLPNVAHLILLTAVLEFSGAILLESVLTYVGVGVDSATFSFGSMINGARTELARNPVIWWPLGTAFAFMIILVLAANLFADCVRDAFDPRYAVTPSRALEAGHA